MLLATLMALTACGGEGTTMKVTTTPPEGNSTPADGITAVSIAIEVKKDGELQNEGTISFSTDLGTFDNSDLEDPVRKTTVELEMGQATAQLYSVQAGTATVRVEYTDAETGLVDASTELAIDFRYALMPSEQEPKPATIEFISADPETIKIFNTSSEGQTSTKITFQVLDKLNLPIADQQIYFSLSRPLGEASLVPSDVKSDINGYAVTYLTSGRVAGVAEVIASTLPHAGDASDFLKENFVAGTAKIHVVAGSANYNNFSLDCDYKSIGGLDELGNQMNCTAYVADRDTQEIPNQPVLFVTEAGAVLPLIYTDSEGKAITTFTAQDPKPYPVSPGELNITTFPHNMELITSETDYFLDALAEKNIVADSSTGGEIFTSNPDINEEKPFYDPSDLAGLQTRNPRDGLVTLIAVTAGEELLTKDLNQNGLCDDGDRFLDMGEPFIDRNDNGLYDDGEYFLDLDQNLTWTGPSDGSKRAYYETSGCENWSKNTQIWKQTKFMMTGDAYENHSLPILLYHSAPTAHVPQLTIPSYLNQVITLKKGQSAMVEFYVLDKNFNIPASNPPGQFACTYDGDVSLEVSPSEPITMSNKLWGPRAIGQFSFAAAGGIATQETVEFVPGLATASCSATFEGSAVGEGITFLVSFNITE